jgi:hypothetical protein
VFVLVFLFRTVAARSKKGTLMPLHRCGACVVASFISLSVIAQASAWQTTVNGRPTSDGDNAVAVEVDSLTGSVFVAGQRQVTAVDTAFVVAKFDAAGAKEWQHVIRGEGGEGSGFASKLAIDANGFVYAAGWISSAGSATHLVLLKLDGRSTRKRVLFSRTVDVEDFSPSINGMRVTPDGGVAVAGLVSAPDGFTRLYLMKFTSDGADAWPAANVLSGTAANFGLNSASAVDVLPGGDVVITGSLANLNTNHDAIVGRFDGATGQMKWLVAFNDPIANGDDFGSALSVGAGGEIVVGGSVFRVGGSFRDFLVFEVNPAGTLVWQTIIDRGFFDAARAVAIAPNGDVVAGGTLEQSSGPAGSIFFVVSLRATDGVERWRHEEPGASYFQEARDVAFDAGGNPVVTGLGATSEALSAFTLEALDRDAGTVLWSVPIVGTTPLVNQGRSIAVDPVRNAVVAAGVTQNQRTSFDLTVTHVTEGHEDWRQVMTGRGKRVDRQDSALAVALNPRNGTIVIAGYTQNTGAGILDFTIAKLRKDGRVAWKYDFEDPLPHDLNVAAAVAVAPDGDTFAAGRSCNTVLTSCFTVVRIGKGGREIWRTIVPGTVPGHDDARAIVLDPADGNVIAAGTLQVAGGAALAVVKLDWRTGEVLWSAASSALGGSPTAIAITSRETVAVAGTFVGHPGIAEFSTQTGSLSASGVLPQFGTAEAVAFDASDGTVVLGGALAPSRFTSAPVVAKFTATGDVVWSAVLGNMDRESEILSIAIDPATGAIAFGGTFIGQFVGTFAVGLLGPDGTERWRNASETGHVTGVAFAADGLVAVGGLGNANRSAAAIVSYSSAGAESWRRTFPGTSSFGEQSLSAIAIDDNRGVIYAAGVVTNESTYSDMFAVGLTFDGSDVASPDDPVLTTSGNE